MNTAKKRAYQEKADAEFRAWSARLDQLRARAVAHKAAGKIEFYEQLEKLGAQRDSMRDRLAELRASSGDAWNDVREGFEGALTEFSTAFRSAIGRFGETSDGQLPPTTASDGSADGDLSTGA